MNSTHTGVTVRRAALVAAIALAIPLAAWRSVRAQQEAGQAVFERVCATCHGVDAKGSVGPNLLPFTRASRDLLAIVRGGGAQMRAFASRDISDDEVTAVAEYLRSISGSSTPDANAAIAQSAVPAPRPPTPGTRATGDVITFAPARPLAPVSDAMLADPNPADWINWRRTLDGWGYSPLNQITQSNVRGLQLVWSWALEPGPSQTTPLVHDGVMYIANPGNIVHALDARTGMLLWEYRRPMDERRRQTVQTRSLAIYDTTVLLSTVDAHIVALDARTGAVRWDTAVGGDATSGFTFTSGPIVADGAIVAGLTGCSRFDEETCYILAVDGRTGKVLWRTSTIARPGEPGGDTWGGLPVTFRAGGDAWMPGSYDPIGKTIYWGTAQAKPWAQAVRGTDGEALYTNSTLALDPKTGQIKWYFQHIPGESYDMDEAFERILIDHDGRSSVFTMGKLGILWELDRKAGKFVRATDTGYQTLMDVNPRTGRATYRPGMIQSVGKEVSFCPSTGGLKSLRAMAYHPATQAVYVPLNLNCETATFEAVERREGGGGAGPVRVSHYSFHPKSPTEMGEMQALDVRSGKQVWRQRRRAPYTTATLTTAGGLVFVGTWDRFVFAYDITSGATLWQTRLPTMANGFPITYAVDGKQYIAVGAGASITGSSWANRVPAALLPEMRNPNAGNGIFVFALAD